MQDHNRLWSKTGADGHGWMTLSRHLTDTASVEPYAWNRFVSRGLEDSLLDQHGNVQRWIQRPRPHPDLPPSALAIHGRYP